MRKENLKQCVTDQFYGASYAIPNTATYLISINGWLDHLKGTGFISDLDQPWKIAMFPIVLLMTLNLGVSNQRIMPKKIAAMLGHEWSSSCLPTTCSSQYVYRETMVSALWKSFVSATSSLALTTDILNLFWFLSSTAGLPVSIASLFALFLLVPNFFAQAVNFSDDSLAFMRKFSCVSPKIFSWLCGTSFAAQQGGLYFNSLKRVCDEIVGGNIWALDTFVKQALFTLNSMMNLHLTVETARCYSKNIFWALTKQPVDTATASPPVSADGQLTIAYTSPDIHARGFQPDTNRLSKSTKLAALSKALISLSVMMILGGDNIVLKVILIVLGVLFFKGNFLTQQVLFQLKDPTSDESTCDRVAATDADGFEEQYYQRQHDEDGHQLTA